MVAHQAGPLTQTLNEIVASSLGACTWHWQDRQCARCARPHETSLAALLAGRWLLNAILSSSAEEHRYRSARPRGGTLPGLSRARRGDQVWLNHFAITIRAVICIYAMSKRDGPLNMSLYKGKDASRDLQKISYGRGTPLPFSFRILCLQLISPHFNCIVFRVRKNDLVINWSEDRSVRLDPRRRKVISPVKTLAGMQAGCPSGSPRARNGAVTLYFRGSCLSQLPVVENCVTLSASLLEPARCVATWIVDQIRTEIDFTLVAPIAPTSWRGSFSRSLSWNAGVPRRVNSCRKKNATKCRAPRVLTRMSM